MIEEKISDFHCRSGKYLATLVTAEYKENYNKKSYTCGG